MKSTLPGPEQLALFEHVQDAYVSRDSLTNNELYEIVAAKAGISRDELMQRSAVGRAQMPRSLATRKVRWHQQTLKHLGLLEKVDGRRGVWRLTDEGKQKLRRINPGFRMLAFSTDLGIAIWGWGEEVFSLLDVPLTLFIGSPPYALRTPRAYGNPTEPVQWSSKRRVQLNVAYEVVYWFTNDPGRVCADNRRVLEPHTDRHARLIAAGGENRRGSFGDGTYTLQPGDFGNPTAGRIPRNILKISHTCSKLRAQREVCRAHGLPLHGAPFPLALPRFLIEFLSQRDDLVADLWGGWLQTAKAAEETGRRWVATERIWEYLRGASERFRGRAGFRFNDGFLRA